MRLGRRGAIQTIAGALGVLLLFATSGCTGETKAGPESSGGNSIATAAAASETTVVAGEATVVELGDTNVTVPADALPEGEVLTGRVGDQPTGVPEGLKAVGPLLEVSTRSSTIGEPAAIDAPAPIGVEGATLVMVWQDDSADQVWRWVPTSYDSETNRVTAMVDHFSFGFLASVDVDDVAGRLKDQLVNLMTGRSGVSSPRCDDEDAAREGGVTVTSDGGDRVKWCFGLEGGKRVLKVSNNTRTFVEISYPKSWKVVDGFSDSISTAALARWMGSLQPNNRSSRIVDGGDTLVLEVTRGARGQVTAEISIMAWLTQAVVFGIEVLLAVLKAVKGPLEKAAKGKLDRTALLLGLSGSGDLAGPLGDCVRDVIETTEADPDGPLSWDATQSILEAALKCIPKLMQAVTDGVKMFAAGAILTMVATAVSLVTTAINLLVSGAREFYDSVASFGGKSDNIYDIRLRVQQPVIDVSSLEAAGFVSPSGNIQCAMWPADAEYSELATVRCDIIEREFDPGPPPAYCHTGWGYAFQIYDDAGIMCAGDTISGLSNLTQPQPAEAVAWFDQAEAAGLAEIATLNANAVDEHAALSYGSTIKMGPLECTMLESGVDCTNTESGHGFKLSRTSYQLIG